jgi:hypothetical protein
MGSADGIDKTMTKSNYALRLPNSLKVEAEKLAAEDGTTLNQFISVAVAEKVAAMKTVAWLTERGRRADVSKALGILSRAGTESPLQDGDEV